MAPTNQQMKASKAKILCRGKAPKARVQRYLKSTDSQLRQGVKSTVLLKGAKCSQAMGQVLKDLRALQAPNAKLLTKKNQIFAFDIEGQLSIEFLATKNDCALLALASKFFREEKSMREDCFVSPTLLFLRSRSQQEEAQ